MKDHATSESSGRLRSSSISSTMLGRVKDRDSEAWRNLVDLFSPRVYQWCRHCGVQPSDAADVVQEVFLSVASKMEDFHRSRSGDTFRGWLWTITRNKVRDHFRRKANRLDPIGGTDAQQQIQQQPEPDSVSTDDPSVEDSRRLLARRALDAIRDRFDEKTWQAFWRMTVDGHSSAEIAEDLRMKKDAVRQAKRRVLQKLRAEVEGLS